jgi:hypothetical protein
MIRRGIKIEISLELLFFAEMKKKGEGNTESLTPFFHSWM